MRISARQALVWSAVGATGLIVGVAAVRRVARHVEATGDERVAALSGDQLIAKPLASLTNAITIHAVPRDVWPWLAQMGAGRAGWYSYDRLDNGGQPSADGVLPQFQQLTAGAIFPALPGATDAFTVASFVPDESLVLGAKAPDGSWLVTWAFVLQGRPGGTTRLVVRVRGGSGYRFQGLPWSVTRLIVPIVHFIMQRKQLLGIAERAEARAMRSLS